MSDQDDIRRATAIINRGIAGNMFPLGTMPESDAVKLMEAEKLVMVSRQAYQVALLVGKAKVPTFETLRDILFEAEVLVGTLDNPVFKDQAATGGQQPSGAASTLPSSSPSLAPSLPASSPTSVAPTTSASTTAPPSPAPSPPPASSSAAPSPSPSAEQPQPGEPGAWLYGPQPQETWNGMAGSGQWVINKLLADDQIEVTSVATSESTVLPRSFFQSKAMDAPSPPPATAAAAVAALPNSDVVEKPPEVVVERVELKVNPAMNTMFYTHPGCKTWTVPLDDVVLPQIGERRECPNCFKPFPITVIDDGGYVSPTYPQEEPSSGSQQQPSGSPASAPPSTTSQPTSQIQQPQDGSPASAQPSEPAAEPSPSTSTVGTGAPVDDHQGDDEYAALLDAVDSDFTPAHFPVPQDLENPPELMPEDLTLGEIENRRLHSQYNALSARARYLWQIDHAKAKRCGRMVKRYMRPAMRAARHELGKDATQTEVKLLAEDDQTVSKWMARQDVHADRADAYSTFFDIYAENVKTLSRDLTYAGAEEQGS